MSVSRVQGAWRAYGWTVIVVVGWGGVLALAVGSLFHWRLMGPISWQGGFNWGLVALDPRAMAALQWLGISLAFSLGVIRPLSGWLEAVTPREGRWGLVALAALAAGASTRGVVAPIIGRALFASVSSWPLGEGGGDSVLTSVVGARVVALLCEAWWLLPTCVLARLLLRRLPRRRVEAIVAVCLIGGVVAQSMDVPYLLAGGGPQGAITNASYLAYLEGFGRERFGYASALLAVVAVLGLAGGDVLRRVTTDLAERDPAEPKPERGRLGPGVTLLLIIWAAAPWIGAWLRQPPRLRFESPTLAWVALTLAAVVLGGLLASRAGVALADALAGGSKWKRWLALQPVFLPTLAWGVLLARSGVHLETMRSGPTALIWLALGLPALMPLLVVALALWRREEVGRLSNALWFLGAWLLWTELAAPLTMTWRPGPFNPLQAGLVWTLSIRALSSPLEAPGLLSQWLVGTAMLYAAARSLTADGKGSAEVALVAKGAPGQVESDGRQGET